MNFNKARQQFGLLKNLLGPAEGRAEGSRANPVPQQCAHAWQSFQLAESPEAKHAFLRKLVAILASPDGAAAPLPNLFGDGQALAVAVASFFAKDLKGHLLPLGRSTEPHDPGATLKLKTELGDWLASDAFAGYVRCLALLCDPAAFPKEPPTALGQCVAQANVPSLLVMLLDCWLSLFHSVRAPVFPTVTEFGHHIAATASATAALDGNVREALQLLRTLAPLPAAFVDLAATAAFGPLFLALSCQTVEPTAVDFQALHIVKETIHLLLQHHHDSNLVDVLWKSSGLHSLVQGLVLVCRRRDAPDFAATAELLCRMAEAMLDAASHVLRVTAPASPVLVSEFEGELEGYRTVRWVLLVLQDALPRHAETMALLLGHCAGFAFVGGREVPLERVDPPERAEKKPFLPPTPAVVRPAVGILAAASRQASRKLKELKEDVLPRGGSKGAATAKVEVRLRVGNPTAFYAVLVETALAASSEQLQTALLEQVLFVLQSHRDNYGLLQATGFVPALLDGLPRVCYGSQVRILKVLECIVGVDGDLSTELTRLLQLMVDQGLAPALAALLLQTCQRLVVHHPPFLDTARRTQLCSALLRYAERLQGSSTLHPIDCLLPCLCALVRAQATFRAEFHQAGGVHFLCGLLSGPLRAPAADFLTELAVDDARAEGRATAALSLFPLLLAELRPAVAALGLLDFLAGLLQHSVEVRAAFRHSGGNAVVMDLLNIYGEFGTLDSEVWAPAAQPSNGQGSKANLFASSPTSGPSDSFLQSGGGSPSNPLAVFDVVFRILALGRPEAGLTSLDAYDSAKVHLQQSPAFLAQHSRHVAQGILTLSLWPSTLETLPYATPTAPMFGFLLPRQGHLIDRGAVCLLLRLLGALEAAVRRDAVRVLAYLVDAEPFNVSCLQEEVDPLLDAMADVDVWPLIRLIAANGVPAAAVQRLRATPAPPGQASLLASSACDGPPVPAVVLGPHTCLHMSTIECDPWPPAAGYSVAWWARFGQGGGDSAIVVQGRLVGWVYVLLFLRWEGGMLQVVVAPSTGALYVRTETETHAIHNAPLRPGQWYHLVLVHNHHRLAKSDLTVYVDAAPCNRLLVPYPNWSLYSAIRAEVDSRGKPASQPDYGTYLLSDGAARLAELVGSAGRERAAPSLFAGVAYLSARKASEVPDNVPALSWYLGAMQFFDDLVTTQAVRCMHLLGPSFRGSFHGTFLPPLDFDLYSSRLSPLWVRHLNSGAGSGGEPDNVYSVEDVLDRDGAVVVGAPSLAAWAADFPAGRVVFGFDAEASEVVEERAADGTVGGVFVGLLNLHRDNAEPFGLLSAHPLLTRPHQQFAQHIAHRLALNTIPLQPDADFPAVMWHVHWLLLACHSGTLLDELPALAPVVYRRLAHYLCCALPRQARGQVLAVADQLLEVVQHPSRASGAVLASRDCCVLVLLNAAVWRSAPTMVQTYLLNTIQSTFLSPTNGLRVFNARRLLDFDATPALLGALLTADPVPAPAVSAALVDLLAAVLDLHPAEHALQLLALFLHAAVPAPNPSQNSPVTRTPSGVSTKSPPETEVRDPVPIVSADAMRGCPLPQRTLAAALLLRAAYQLLHSGKIPLPLARKVWPAAWVLGFALQLAHPVLVAYALRIAVFLMVKSQDYAYDFSHDNGFIRLRTVLEPYCNQEEVSWVCLHLLLHTVPPVSCPLSPSKPSPSTLADIGWEAKRPPDTFGSPAALPLLLHLIRCNSDWEVDAPVYPATFSSLYFAEALCPKAAARRRWTLAGAAVRAAVRLRRQPKALDATSPTASGDGVAQARARRAEANARLLTLLGGLLRGSPAFLATCLGHASEVLMEVIGVLFTAGSLGCAVSDTFTTAKAGAADALASTSMALSDSASDDEEEHGAVDGEGAPVAGHPSDAANTAADFVEVNACDVPEPLSQVGTDDAAGQATTPDVDVSVLSANPPTDVIDIIDSPPPPAPAEVAVPEDHHLAPLASVEEDVQRFFGSPSAEAAMGFALGLIHRAILTESGGKKLVPLALLPLALVCYPVALAGREAEDPRLLAAFHTRLLAGLLQTLRADGAFPCQATGSAAHLDPLVDMLVDRMYANVVVPTETVVSFMAAAVTRMGSRDRSTSERLRRHLNRAVLFLLSSQYHRGDEATLLNALTAFHAVLPVVLHTSTPAMDFIAGLCAQLLEVDVAHQPLAVQQLLCDIWRQLAAAYGDTGQLQAALGGVPVAALRAPTAGALADWQAAHAAALGRVRAAGAAQQRRDARHGAGAQGVLAQRRAEYVSKWRPKVRRYLDRRRGCRIPWVAAAPPRVCMAGTMVPAEAVAKSGAEAAAELPHCVVAELGCDGREAAGHPVRWRLGATQTALRVRRKLLPYPTDSSVPPGQVSPVCPEAETWDGHFDRLEGHTRETLAGCRALIHAYHSCLVGDQGTLQPLSRLALAKLLPRGSRVVFLSNGFRIHALDPTPVFIALTTHHLFVLNHTALDAAGQLGRSPGAPAAAPGVYLSLPLVAVVDVHRRRYQQRGVGVEVVAEFGLSVLLVALDRTGQLSEGNRDQLYESVVRLCTNHLPRHHVSVDMPLYRSWKLQIQQRWLNRELTNFDYLMHLNTLAGRTTNDLNQYPVFPWILRDYSSSTLDLTDANVYRDLSKPMGAQDPRRADDFRQRYADWDDPVIPAFHYGSHYSSAGVVLHYLVRLQPFSSLSASFQGGRLDIADRLFHSMKASWDGASSGGLADIKELIPEFFYLPDFLVNINDLDMGVRSEGGQLGNVVLPPWSHGDAALFVKLHRDALEGDYVSAHLHEWIDLVFGGKQQGPEAVQALNVFHPLTYESGVADVLSNPRISDAEREALVSQIAHFGQTPNRLFSKPHPSRTASSCSPAPEPQPAQPKPAPSLSGFLASMALPSPASPERESPSPGEARDTRLSSSAPAGSFSALSASFGSLGSVCSPTLLPTAPDEAPIVITLDGSPGSPIATPLPDGVLPPLQLDAPPSPEPSPVEPAPTPSPDVPPPGSAAPTRAAEAAAPPLRSPWDPTAPWRWKDLSSNNSVVVTRSPTGSNPRHRCPAVAASWQVVDSVAVTEDGCFLATAGCSFLGQRRQEYIRFCGPTNFGQIVSIDDQSRSQEFNMPIGDPMQVCCIAVSATGAMVLVGTTTGLVHVMRLLRDDRPDMPAPLALARRAVRDAAGQLSRDGAGLVILGRLVAHLHPIAHLILGAEHCVLVTCPEDGKDGDDPVLWHCSLQQTRRVCRLTGMGTPVSCGAVNAGTGDTVLCTQIADVFVWDVQGVCVARASLRPGPAPSPVTALTTLLVPGYSGGTAFFVTGHADGSLHIFRYSTPDSYCLPGQRNPGAPLASNSDTVQVVTVIAVPDCPTGPVTAVCPTLWPAAAIAWHSARLHHSPRGPTPAPADLLYFSNGPGRVLCVALPAPARDFLLTHCDPSQ